MPADIVPFPAALAIAPYAALLGLIYIYLAIRVVRERYRARVALGAGGDAGLERAIRVHGNFAEYVPFGLLLIFFVGAVGWAPWVTHLLGALLLAARSLHAYGVSQTNENLTFRKLAMMATFGALAVSAFLLLTASLGKLL